MKFILLLPEELRFIQSQVQYLGHIKIKINYPLNRYYLKLDPKNEHICRKEDTTYVFLSDGISLQGSLKTIEITVKS